MVLIFKYLSCEKTHKPNFHFTFHSFEIEIPPHGNEHLHILVKIYTYNTVKNIKNIRNRRFIVTLYRHRNLISNEI